MRAVTGLYAPSAASEDTAACFAESSNALAE
jgi:hypothetical protein